jgi:hypothetical protein
MKLGHRSDGSEVFVPFSEVVPLISPNELVVGGWDISSMNLADSMDRAQVRPSRILIFKNLKHSLYFDFYRFWSLI